MVPYEHIPTQQMANENKKCVSLDPGDVELELVRQDQIVLQKTVQY
jgi:hypothetical protein